MKALAIEQPWPWAIIHLGKDVENRSWPTRYRGRFLIHACLGFDADGYAWLQQVMPDLPVQIPLPSPDEFPRGGIVGSAVIRDCVRASDSRWFVGPFGFLLQGAQALPFVRCRGRLGFFDPGLPPGAAPQPTESRMEAIP